jgi:radical SAM protein with 4Fe4S-binding SPASM domain
VNSGGDVSACEYYNWDKSFGNILFDDFEKILRSENFEKFSSEQQYVNTICKKCKFLNLCGNGCSRMRVENGDFDIKGRYVYCEQRKQLYNEISGYFAEVKKRGGGK